MIGKTILHYHILKKLGEAEKMRFVHEAQATVLNHPNIVTINAIEKVDDEMFIVMEYIKAGNQEIFDWKC